MELIAPLGLRPEPVPVSAIRRVSRLKMKAVRITSAEIERAKAAAADAGLRLVGLEKRPDGTVKFEFGDFEANDDWRADCVLYGSQQ